jgi:HK97 family phage portal protein
MNIPFFGKKAKDNSLDNELRSLKLQFEDFKSGNKALFEFLTKGTYLNSDMDMRGYVTQGFEGNPDVYSIFSFCADLFGTIKSKVVEVQRNGDVKEVTDSPVHELMNRPNGYQTWDEYRQLWELFYLVTGNAIQYAPRYKAGNNMGQLMKDGLTLLPTQYISIESGGWNMPIGQYLLNFDTSIPIDPVDVIHTRMPNLEYQGGSNFMGMSPLRVAANTILSQNYSSAMVRDMMKRGFPPGILSNKTKTTPVTPEESSALEKAWRRRHTNEGGKSGIPVFTAGDMTFTKIGSDNFRDLMILEMSQDGRRILCNLLHIPSEIFNDKASSTYNNMEQVDKRVYTKRLMQDDRRFLAAFNSNIARFYGNYKLIPDYSDIPELQEDKAIIAAWGATAVQNGAITRNEFRGKLGFDARDEEGMDMITVPSLITPIDDLTNQDITPDTGDYIPPAQ